jgi:hypothetical protein
VPSDVHTESLRGILSALDEIARLLQRVGCVEENMIVITFWASLGENILFSNDDLCYHALTTTLLSRGAYKVTLKSTT